MDAATMRRMLNQAEPRADTLGRAAAHRVQAGEALERARALAEKKDWAGALRQAQLAFVFEAAYLRAEPWADDGTRARATELWRQADEALRQRAVTAMPALGKRLDLVIRNADLRRALETVAGAAGLTVNVDAGSLDDAAALTGAPLRVAWLDLRRATAGQGFTWLVQPFGLEWTVEGGTVVVRSARGAAGSSVWTYDVRDLAPKDPADFEKSAERVAGTGASIVRLLARDRLLVMGDARAHRQTAEFLATLRKGSAPAPDAKLVRERAAARSAAALDEFSWALLAAACSGSVDAEAASELVEAVADREALATVAERAPVLALRTLWAIAQARALAPDDPTLARLAATASPALAPALRLTGTRPQARTGVSPAAAVYLALLRHLPPSFRPAGLDAPSPGEDGKASLEALARQPLSGDDAAVLAGLAHRLAGRDAWNAARDDRARLAGRAGLSAGALRVLNRLERARLAGL